MEYFMNIEKGKGETMYKFKRLNLYLEQFSAQFFILLLSLGAVLFSSEIREALDHGVVYVAEITKILSN